MPLLLKSERQLLDAIEQCQLHKIIELVKQGHNIHERNSLGQNYLVLILQQQNPSLARKRFQIFEYLITNYNLNIHSFDHNRKNVFNWATNLNRTKEALYLLNTNPGDIDILARDQSGSCSLHYAVEHGNDIVVHAIVNYLLRYRLRFDIKDAHNNTPEELAIKLGYDKIGHFLSEACRSTVYMSREIPLADKSKIFASASSPSFLETSEYFNLIETKINAAKDLDDWKTVATLRASKKSLHEKKTLDPIPQLKTPKISPPKLPSINPTSSSSKFDSQSEQMLRLIEPQMTPSFRRPFVPIYQQPIESNLTTRRISHMQNKMSPASSRRVSSVYSFRKRDSEASQMSIQDVQNRFSIPPVYKQYRPSGIPTN